MQLITYKLYVILIMFGIAIAPLSSQNKQYRADQVERRLDELTEVLGLSDEQIQSIKQSSSYENLMDGKLSRRESRQAFKESLDEVLTSDQKAKLAEIPNEGPRGNRSKRGGIRSKAERTSERPSKRNFGKKLGLEKVYEMRAELDQSISDEDKKILSELRKILSSSKESRKTLKKERKTLSQDERRLRREEYHAQFEPARRMVEKYDDPITDIFEANRSYFEKLKEDIGEKKRHGKAGRKGDDKNRKHHAYKKRRSAKKGMGLAYSQEELERPKKFRFLMMEPNDTKAKTNASGKSNLRLSPNPASDRIQLSYTLDSRQSIKIVLYDSQGQLLQTLLNEEQDAGRYTRSLDLSNYADSSYYVTLYQGGSNTTEKLLIQK